MLNLKVVFASFIVSFIILLILGFLVIGNLMNFSGDDSIVESKNAGLNFVIPNQQDINLLITVCEEKPKPADIYLLIKISACDNLVCVANIPKTTYTMVDSKRGNLQELFDWGGINCVKEAIENITNIEIDRTIQIDDDGLKEIMQYVNKSNVDDSLADEQFVDGDYFCEILRTDPIKTIAFLQNNFNLDMSLDDFFDEISIVCNTNITKYDFEIRKIGFQQMIFNSNCEFVSPVAEFENVYGYDRLTDESKKNFFEAFGKKISVK